MSKPWLDFISAICIFSPFWIIFIPLPGPYYRTEATTDYIEVNNKCFGDFVSRHYSKDFYLKDIDMLKSIVNMKDPKCYNYVDIHIKYTVEINNQTHNQTGVIRYNITNFSELHDYTSPFIVYVDQYNYSEFKDLRSCADEAKDIKGMLIPRLFVLLLICLVWDCDKR